MITGLHLLSRNLSRLFCSGGYCYGYQGSERDDEVKGEGNSVNYKYRMHDPRIGRFFAVDPLTSKYPHYTPYSFSGNKVIAFVELEGKEELNAVNIDNGTFTPAFTIILPNKEEIIIYNHGGVYAITVADRGKIDSYNKDGFSTKGIANNTAHYYVTPFDNNQKFVVEVGVGGVSPVQLIVDSRSESQTVSESKKDNIDLFKVVRIEGQFTLKKVGAAYQVGIDINLNSETLNVTKLSPSVTKQIIKTQLASFEQKIIEVTKDRNKEITKAIFNGVYRVQSQEIKDFYKNSVIELMKKYNIKEFDVTKESDGVNKYVSGAKLEYVETEKQTVIQEL